MLSLQEVEDAAAIVYAAMPPTPQYAWPLLARRTGCEVWVKHENHTPIGAFKVRGGLVYMERLKHAQPGLKGVISATRGNHGQSIALGAAKVGIAATIVVPHGNSVEKNAAMRAFGAELVEAGHDFDAARDVAVRLASERGLAMVPSFHRDLVRGVATYALELFRGAPPLDTVYVPIGLGSGICGVIAMRDALEPRDQGGGRGVDRGAGLCAVLCRRQGRADQQRRHHGRRHGRARSRRRGAGHHPEGRRPHRAGERRRDRRRHARLLRGHAPAHRRRRARQRSPP